MDKKGLGFLLLAGLLITSALVFLPSVQDTPKVEAQTNPINVSGKVTGWMWSTGVGWIKLSNKSSDPVKITNNSLSGYGWSDGVGWINFAPAGPYPSAPQNSVKINTENYDGPEYPVIGWARACSVFVTGCSGTLKTSAELGGWDGWIRMENSVYDIDSQVFSGQAWGNLNLAWVGFYAGTPIDDPDCTVGVNCLCTDTDPPPGCPPTCTGPNCCKNPPCDGQTRSLTCTASPTTVDVGGEVTYTAVASPSGDYTYEWGGNLGTVSPTPTGSNFVTTYTTPGVVNNVNVNVSGFSLANCNVATNAITVCVPLNGPATRQEDCCDLFFDDVNKICVPPPGDCTFGIGGIPGMIEITFRDREARTYSPVAKSLIISPSTGCTSNPLNLTVTANLDQDVNGTLQFECSTDSGSNWGACTGLTKETILRASAVYNKVVWMSLNLDRVLITLTNASNTETRWVKLFDRVSN